MQFVEQCEVPGYVVTGGRPRQSLGYGLIASVSGNAVQVTETTGTATVDVSPSTKVTESTTAQLTDIAAGNCVTVACHPPAPAPGGPVTAAVRASEPRRGVTASARNRRPDLAR